MFTIDGITYTFPCDIERIANISSSDISGYLMNGDYNNDVIGTYFTYNVSLVVPVGQENDYNSLYEVLTNPVDSHVFIFPYGDDLIQFSGRIENVSDKLYFGKWVKTKFSAIANEPSKESVFT